MSKVTYNRGERQKPTTPDYRNNYDQIDWSKKPDPADDDKAKGPSSMWDDVRNRLAFTDGYL